MQSDESTAISAPTHTGSSVTEAAGKRLVGKGPKHLRRGGVIRTEEAEPPSLSNIDALQVTPVQPVRSSEQKETTTNWSCGHTDSITHSCCIQIYLFAMCSKETDSGSDKRASLSVPR